MALNKYVPLWREVDFHCEAGCNDFQCLNCKQGWTSLQRPSEWLCCPYCQVEWVREWTNKNKRWDQPGKWTGNRWSIEVFGFRDEAHTRYWKNEVPHWHELRNSNFYEWQVQCHPLKHKNYPSGISGWLKISFDNAIGSYCDNYPKRILLRKADETIKIIPWVEQ